MSTSKQAGKRASKQATTVNHANKQQASKQPRKQAAATTALGSTLNSVTYVSI